MNNTTFAIITLIPVIVFGGFRVWLVRRIASKLSNKIDRKKYKKVFIKNYNDTFTPFLIATPLVLHLIKDFSHDTTLEKIAFILKIFVLISAVMYSTLIFPKFKKQFKNLKILKGQELLETVDK